MQKETFPGGGKKKVYWVDIDERKKVWYMVENILKQK